MARPTRWRSAANHELIAGEVHHRHAQASGWTLSMPVPIEAIVEQTYGLTIEWDTLDEPPGGKILGALYPSSKTIVLNDTHETMFTTWMGPYEFTLAHELGHWLYDADPNQGNLFDHLDEAFCYSRESTGLSKDLQARETSANKLAASLLMPTSLVRSADIDDVVSHIRDYADAWGVSKRALEIRLTELEFIDDDPWEEQLRW